MVTRRWVLGAAAVAAADLRMKFDARADETYANKTVFMTSDDGPDAATSIIIDIAERHQVPFTLFMIGTNVAADPDHRKLIERARASVPAGPGARTRPRRLAATRNEARRFGDLS